ncbi:YegS/Rv2252/BmrU family lipid kinase [Clostridium sp. MCC353]|uniref:diacylglycerol/lipid kinase family protein n=1 Tax=Clostridium sp. MCC353 TaxID=2592646 RepID=UPI001C030B1D|nr:YegS/Rv2252/BmrU family lipid kinase [Clostridium sp. MCC353]MBT9777546.1 YegS/Rv2252/BmrU family lipid kinase [Clostridium sp. MCC353]
MYHFIVNPNACCGRGVRIWKKLERQLDSANIEYEAHLTKQQGDAKRFARELTEGMKDPKMIVAVGGDGTVNEVLDGISFCGPVTFGYIPAGSGNDLARSLKISKNPYRALKKVLNPRYHKLLDYGVVSYGEDVISYRRFMVSAGIGLDAAICHNILHSRLRSVLNRLHLNGLSYILIGIRQLLCAKSVKGYILLDGVQKVEFNHIYFISAHIHPYEGGGFKFAPKADYSDGKLAVCVVNGSSRRKLIPVLAGARLKKYGRHPGIRNFECRELVIHTDKPLAVHVDGESCLCQQDLQIRCIEKKIRIIV